MHRRDLLALSGASTAALLAGCIDAGSGEDGDPPNWATADLPEGEPNVDDERLAELATGNAEFALDLHQTLATDADANLFLSPYSVSVALAMTYAGARGETREQIAETLQYSLGEDVHPAFADLRAALEARETATDPVEEEEVDAFQLDAANALWGRDGFPFAEDYLAQLEEHYGAGLRRADFSGDPDGERERINQWVADATENRIEDLLPPDGISPQTVLVLTNAIYFLASWAHEFDPADTEDGTFTTLDGTESTVPFMHQNVRTNHASLPGLEAVELPYVGEEVSMVLLLPERGTFESFEQSLDADRLFGVFDELSDARGDLALPKFEFETEVQLSDALAELGMPAAFGAEAEFGGMVEGGGGGLFIDEAYHQTFVSVDEQGTEAAASTAVVMYTSAPPNWGELRFDRPFLFCIRDRPTDAVLFLGRVGDAGDAQGS